MKGKLYLGLLLLLLPIAFGSTAFCQPISEELIFENDYLFTQHYKLEADSDKFTFLEFSVEPGQTVKTSYTYNPKCAFGDFNHTITVYELAAKTKYSMPFTASIEGPDYDFRASGTSFCNKDQNVVQLTVKNNDAFTNGFLVKANGLNEKLTIASGGEETVEYTFSHPIQTNIIVTTTSYLGGLEKSITLQVNRCSEPDTWFYSQLWIAIGIAVLFCLLTRYLIRRGVRRTVKDISEEVEETLESEKKVNWLLISLLIAIVALVSGGLYVSYQMDVIDLNQTIALIPNVSDFCYQDICNYNMSAIILENYAYTESIVLENLMWIIIWASSLVILLIVYFLIKRRRRILGDNRLKLL